MKFIAVPTTYGSADHAMLSIKSRELREALDEPMKTLGPRTYSLAWRSGLEKTLAPHSVALRNCLLRVTRRAAELILMPLREIILPGGGLIS